ncbi:unnamed protein product [Strongylus vulgaris]|uniref:Uncharacterized protein n=1 Tax=Strongylus vulgaris TaxID=40348 RepID=A0A3P7J2M8_STRVU|nr:unnamed protein product [Strongylus vulgaris]
MIGLYLSRWTQPPLIFGLSRFSLKTLVHLFFLFCQRLYTRAFDSFRRFVSEDASSFSNRKNICDITRWLYDS